jgi:hypothetical protein
LGEPVGRGRRRASKLTTLTLLAVALIAFGGIAYIGETGAATSSNDYYYYYSPDPSIVGSGTSLTAVEGTALGGTVATFTDPDASATTTEYAATIAWGDGASSSGTISGPTGGPFAVSGLHTYSDEGTNVVTVTITDIDAGQGPAQVTSSVAVSDAQLSATCAGELAAFKSFSGSLATLADANPLATSADFSATVHWGDGTSSPGTASGATGGPFTISGDHTYASLGNFTITIDVQDEGGASASVACQLLMFSFPTTGAFVLGDTTVASAGPSTTVTWWSANWSTLNKLSGGTAPSAFKGFAASVNTLPNTSPANVCTGTWSAGGGSSPPPPATAPPYMGVIVASKITKAPGGVVHGNYDKIVVVKTNPGYGGPGSAGTGTIVGTFCG